jgi:hypothetical protein
LFWKSARSETFDDSDNFSNWIDQKSREESEEEIFGKGGRRRRRRNDGFLPFEEKVLVGIESSPNGGSGL